MFKNNILSGNYSILDPPKRENRAATFTWAVAAAFNLKRPINTGKNQGEKFLQKNMYGRTKKVNESIKRKISLRFTWYQKTSSKHEKKTFIDVNRKSENIISFKKYSDGKFRRESVRWMCDIRFLLSRDFRGRPKKRASRKIN